MAERAAILQAVQLGVETTPGTAVAANRKLLATSFVPTIEASIQHFRPAGGKFATVQALGKESVSASIEGQGVYTDPVYLLASLLNYAAPAQQAATTAYKWTFSPAQAQADAIKTFTVEYGGAVRASRFAYGVVNEFNLDFDRDEVTVGGSMFGQQLDDGITLTATPTEIELVPILPKEIDVFIDTTSGALGTTKMLRAFSGSFSVGNRYGQVWPLNSALGSYDAHVELEPEATLTLMLEADAAGMALLTALRAGTKLFVRVKATSGQLAGTAIPYSFQLDFCGTVESPEPFEDMDGVYAWGLTLRATYDSGWAKAFQVEIINKLTGL